jgi:hypothetical protein
MAARLSDAVLNNATQGYNLGQQNVMLNPVYGGQQGYAQNLEQWVSSAAYIRKNLIFILLEAPTGFSYLPNGQQYVNVLRALTETQALSITGLQAALHVDSYANDPVGGSGQMFQTPNNVTMDVPAVTFRFLDRYGMSITRFFEAWIRTLIMDPDTKIAGINTLSLSSVTDMLPDMYSMSGLFIEPDPTGATVVKSWLGTNMYPTTSGPIEGSRDKTQAGQEAQLEIPFTGVYQYGIGVNLFAQSILSAMSLSGANPYNQEAFIQGIDADVAASTEGYATSVATVAEESVL